MEAVVWDIKTRLDEIFAFLSEISLRAGRKEDYKIYQSFPRLLIQRKCVFKKQVQQFIKAVKLIVFYSNSI